MKKLAITIMAAALAIGLAACGAKEEERQNAQATVSESETVEKAAAGAGEGVESVEESNEKSEAEGTETAEAEKAEPVKQEVNLPDFYMDEEGIKSGKLGIQIRKDSADWENMGLLGNCYVCVPSATGRTSYATSFQCNYYEGDIDSYISEHEGMKKGNWEGITYAYSDREAAIVGNGIAFSISYFEEEIESYWENSLKVCEKDMEYLAYNEGSVLYCPALGISFSGEKNDDDGFIGIKCGDLRYVDGSYEGGKINIEEKWESLYSSANNVEEKLENRIQNMNLEGNGASVIEETVERKLGSYQYMGRGVLQGSGGENWYFMSDDLYGSIDISYVEGEKLEDYLSLIEELEQ